MIHFKKYFYLIFLLIFFSNIFIGKNIFAQNADLIMLQQHFAESKKSNSINHSKILHFKNPLLFPFGIALFFYQKIISPQWLSNCPHYPSCSNFSLQSIKKFGIIKGIALSADRLSRCSAFGLRDYPSYQYDFFSGKIIDEPVLYYNQKKK
jgi:uncharacterized protein